MVLLFQEPFKKHLTKNLAKLLCYSFQFLMFLMRMNEVINPNSLTIYCQRYCCCLESLNLKFIDPSAPSQTTKSNKKCCEDGVTFKEKLECNPAGKIQWLCCTFSGGVVLIVWFTTNRMCVRNNTIIYVAQASNSKIDCEHDLYCCLLPRCEALRTCRLGFPIATVVQSGKVRYLWKGGKARNSNLISLLWFG